MLVVDLVIHKVTKAFGVRVRDYVIDFCRGVFFFLIPKTIHYTHACKDTVRQVLTRMHIVLSNGSQIFSRMRSVTLFWAESLLRREMLSFEGV